MYCQGQYTYTTASVLVSPWQYMCKITHISVYGLPYAYDPFFLRSYGKELSLLDHNGFHRVDRWQKVRDQVPAIAAICAGKDLARVCANIDSAGIERI